MPPMPLRTMYGVLLTAPRAILPTCGNPSDAVGLQGAETSHVPCPHVYASQDLPAPSQGSSTRLQSAL
eukprot:2658353-Alexandrium_andersonii.AAC.1